MVDVNVGVDRIMLEIKPTLHCIAFLRDLLCLSSSVMFLVVGYGSGGLIPRLNSSAAEKEVPQNAMIHAMQGLFLTLFYQHRHLHR